MFTLLAKVLRNMAAIVQTTGSKRRGAWHVSRDGAVLLLSRRMPARFDLGIATTLPIGGAPVSRERLAHQVRQDLWRGLRMLRGFRPAVRVERASDGLHVLAGGALDYGLTKNAMARAESVLEDLLTDGAHRQRWLRHAGLRGEGVGA